MINHVTEYNIAALPIYAIMIIATISRRLTKGRPNRLLFWVILMAFVAAFADFLNNIVVWGFPLEYWKVVWIKVFNYVYFLSRHSLNMLLILFFYAVSHTWFRIRELWKKILVVMPYLVAVAMYTVNLWTGYLYTVTAEEGYQRGDYIVLPTVLVTGYMLFGVYLLAVDKKFLELPEWLSLVSIYVFNIMGILIQLFREDIVVEGYFTAISILFMVLFVQKPEKQLVPETGMPGVSAFKETMRKIELTGEKVQVVIAQVKNSDELIKFMGNPAYIQYIQVVQQKIDEFAKKEKIDYEFYFDMPDMIYVIIENTRFNPVQAIGEIKDNALGKNSELTKIGMVPLYNIVTVTFPDELSTASSVVHLGQRLSRYTSQKIYYHAPQITEQRDYQIERRFEEIYRRAVETRALDVKFVPVWSCAQDKNLYAMPEFSIQDPTFGTIDEETITALAKVRGATGLVEQYMMDQVFRYAGSGSLGKNGLSCVIVRLSATLASQKNFTDEIWNLRSQYNVHPEQICFTFTEIGDRDSGDGLMENIRKLSLQGYGIALDGYGNGKLNLNIRRISGISIKFVRLDKILIDEMQKEGGKEVLSETISVLKSVPFSVVAPGVDNEKTKEKLFEMGCDLMMGNLFTIEDDYVSV